MRRYTSSAFAVLCALFASLPRSAPAAPRLPDLVCEIHEVSQGSANSQPALRFGTWAINLGAGPIELHADTLQPGTSNVYQWIYDTNGSHTETLIGNFVVDQNNRVRFSDSADFFLREVMEDNSVGSVLASNEKVAYCFVDSHRYSSSPPAPAAAVYGGSGPGTYPACGNVLGTSVGWVDNYPPTFSGQYIYLTGLSSGTYWLENSLDPLNRIVESNDNNNSARVKVTISTGRNPEVNLLGNSQSIASGDTSPRAADHTDFGFAEVPGGIVTRTFTIQNTGSGTLSLTGVPRVKIIGSADFSLVAPPSSPVIAGGSATFQVTYDPSGLNSNAEILITNNDGNESSYRFAIRGNSDSDADGLPDEWETLHGLSDPAADEDGDGASNHGELIAGTLPRDAQSVFRISAARLEGGTFHVTWPSVSGRLYKLYAAPDLSPADAASPDWELVGEWPGTGAVIDAAVPATADSGRFFRVTTGY